MRLAFIFSLLCLTANAALPSFNSFNAGQFTNDGNTISLAPNQFQPVNSNLTNWATVTTNSVVYGSQIGTLAASNAATTLPLVMSAAGGGVPLTDMLAATAAFPGQMGLGFTSTGEFAPWWALAAGTGSNVWNRSAVDFFQGIYQIGHPTQMPSAQAPGMQIYFNGNAANSTYAAAVANRNGSCLFVNNENPFTDGAWICFPVYTTNGAGLGTAVLTNADGVKIYIRNAFGMQVGQVPREHYLGEQVLAGFYQLLFQADMQMAIAMNTTGFGTEGAGYREHSFVQFDNRYFQNSSLPLATRFPVWVSNVESCTNAGWIDAFKIDHLLGLVNTYSNLYVGGALRATNNAVQHVIGPNFFNTAVPVGLFIPTNTHFWLSDPGAVTWDGGDNYRLGIVKAAGQYPKHAHASGAPFIIARSSSSTLQTAVQTITDEFTIAADGSSTTLPGAITGNGSGLTNLAPFSVTTNIPASYYERDGFMHFNQDSTLGDLHWYYSFYGGGGQQSALPSTATQNGPNWPRIGVVVIGNTSTTAGAGAHMQPNFINGQDNQPFERPDLWTNWAMHLAFKLSTTNTTRAYAGLQGGASWGNGVITDPSSGIYVRWNSPVETQAKFALIVKNGATVTTNYLSAANTAWHDFVFYNDTGITNVVRCSVDGAAPVSVTNALGNTSLGAGFNISTSGGTAPAFSVDYYDFGINGITQ